MNLFKRSIWLLVAAIVLGLFLSGFRVGHTKDGMSNALGSASSGIVVYHKANSFSVGAKVIASVDKPAKSPVLALVRAQTPTTADIQVGAKLVRIKPSQVYGKLIAVVPFIGSILGFVGL